MLDILQSAIIAMIIAILVFGIHLMTMRTRVENDVMQRMQVQADAVAAMLQAEIRTLLNFVPDQDFTSDKITFINTENREVVIIYNNETGNIDVIYVSEEESEDDIERTYNLDLFVTEGSDIFNLLSWDDSVDDYVLASNTGEVDLLRLEFNVKSRQEDLYQDIEQEFRLKMVRDIFLRNINLPKGY